jgi:YidC/Oxa1 family membrane protein insertase
MADLLYNLIIYPLEAVIEVFYLLFQRVARSPGIAVVGVSLAVNILALPLYAKAEKWQRLEREIQKRLKPKVDAIKAVFRGDERMMILSTYYRQNGYHPFYALRSSFGLLLQIPFFIAAYAFLVKQPGLRGAPFLFIKDLSAPDALIAAGSLRINLLPVLMTLINVAAAAVYVKGFPAREKIQLYGMAALFLALLYTSPAALTLYWTLNNLFSLAKNLVYKARRPLRAFYLIMASLTAAVSCYILFFHDTTNRKRLVVAAIAALVILSPLVVKAIGTLLERRIAPALEDRKERSAVFFLSIASLAVLAGLTIPMGLISTSAQEFSFIGNRDSPFGFIWLAFSKAAGQFFFWPAVLYFLFGNRAKSLLAAFAAALVPVAILDVFAFKGDYGLISRQFAFPNRDALRVGAAMGAANIAAIAGAAALILAAISIRRTKAVRTVLIVCLLTLTSMSGYWSSAIASDYSKYAKIRAAEAAGAPEDPGAALKPVYRLSKSGKNVVVFMLDRAISAFVPQMMKEDPSLAERFRGFVWYPNTLSFNGHTLAAAPPFFGGYDYTPEEMNRRSDESLVSKHNEALSVMPRIFAEAGWESAISDASWANYSWVPDNSVFAKYQGVRAFNLEERYTQKWLKERGMESDPSKRIERNLLWFSMLRISPMPLRFGLYDGGEWWDTLYQADDLSEFIDAYAPLYYLPELVDYSASGSTFNLIVNNTTHETRALTYPGYEPARSPVQADGHPAFGTDEEWHTYQVNAAAFRLVGAFLDGLRANGTYENTMIVIASDHGNKMPEDAFKAFGNRMSDIAIFNPMLMVKDFGADGPIAEDDRFRTNADVPAIAARALDGAANPFTGNPLRELAKGETVMVVDKSIIDPSEQNRNTMKFDQGDLLAVRGDLFVPENWSAAR